jgi:hypothetical protein
MGDKTNKFLLVAAAGMLVARAVPAVPPPAEDMDARLEAALQAVHADQMLVIDDIDGDSDLGLY